MVVGEIRAERSPSREHTERRPAGLWRHPQVAKRQRAIMTGKAQPRRAGRLIQYCFGRGTLVGVVGPGR